MRVGFGLVSATLIAGITMLALPSCVFAGEPGSSPITAPAMELPDAPQPSASLLAASAPQTDSGDYSSSADLAWSSELTFLPDPAQATPSAQGASQSGQRPKRSSDDAVDANGVPIPLDRRQPKRILGIMPNFRSVASGSTPHPPGWKYNFIVATHQATDYSSFIFLGLTSITGEGMNVHPVLGKGADGFYAYVWRGFLDKTDGNYLSGWLLPSLIHEDIRFYALGKGHHIAIRALYVISRQGVTRTYGGRQTPNIAVLGGKVLTQIVSRTYYPTGATSFSVLATKFGYACMRDVTFTSIREFYPDAAAHFVRKHREKAAREAARDAATTP
jgi:hypothetical protein